MTGSQDELQRFDETDELDWPDIAVVLPALYAHAEHQTEQLGWVRRHLRQIDERLSAVESGSAASSDALADLRAELLEDAGDDEGEAA